jgi:hypothetical protein
LHERLIQVSGSDFVADTFTHDMLSLDISWLDAHGGHALSITALKKDEMMAVPLTRNTFPPFNRR